MIPSYEINRFNFSSKQNVTLPDSAKKLALIALKQWQKRDKLSPTTKLVALDCIFDSEGKLRIFSFDSRPQGLALLKLHKPSLGSMVESLSVSTLPEEFNHSPFDNPRGGTMFPDHPSVIFDEQLDAYLADGPVCSPNPSISYNNYGEGWLWQSVMFGSHEEAIDFDSGFSLKAINQRKVFVCPPAGKRGQLKKTGIHGVRTVSQMIRKLEEHGSMYYQPYIEPLKSPDGWPMIYSLYFKHESRDNKYVYLGGLSLARPHLNVVLNSEGVIFGIID